MHYIEKLYKLGDRRYWTSACIWNFYVLEIDKIKFALLKWAQEEPDEQTEYYSTLYDAIERAHELVRWIRPPLTDPVDEQYMIKEVHESFDQLCREAQEALLDKLRVASIRQRLLEASRHDPLRLIHDLVPNSKGIYGWFTKGEDQLVYIGKATGGGGLYQRIVKQHLNPEYLETRAEKHTSKDIYQTRHPVDRNGRIAIDKSAFRKNVARRARLQAGEESVEFVKQHFNFSFLILDNLTAGETAK